MELQFDDDLEQAAPWLEHVGHLAHAVVAVEDPHLLFDEQHDAPVLGDERDAPHGVAGRAEVAVVKGAALVARGLAREEDGAVDGVGVEMDVNGAGRGARPVQSASSATAHAIAGGALVP